MREARTALAAMIVAALLLTGCGNDDPGTDPPAAAASTAAGTPEENAAEPEPEKSDKPRPTGPFADITFEGDSAKPNGERVDLEVGQTLTLRISSDRPGELHVHATPEQEVAFPAGQSERKLTFDQPGVVSVEDHESGLVLLQLEVR
jgi:hypothetical protein